MRQVIFFLTLLSLTLNVYSQDTNRKRDKFDFVQKSKMIDFQLGYAIEDGAVPIGLSFGFNRWLFGFSVGIPGKWDAKGPNYSDSVNWGEFPEDNTGEFGTYSLPIEVDLGYKVWKNIAVGIGASYIGEYYYKNMYDHSHILGDNGRYHLVSKDGNKFAANVFANIYLPVDKRGFSYLLLQPKYSTYYKFIGSVGFGAAF